MRSAGAPNTFLLTCSALYVSEALHLPLWSQVKTARAYIHLFCTIFAEADVRVRVRGRVVSVHRQRGQVRVVRVVTATEATHQPSVQPPYHSNELNLTTGGYSDSRVPFDRWHGFLCIVAVAPLPYINPSKSLLGFTVKNFPCRAA